MGRLQQDLVNFFFTLQKLFFTTGLKNVNTTEQDL